MSGPARCFRLAWVAALAIAGTVWGPAAASACGTGEAPPGRSCCAGTMGAACGCCAPATATARPESVASVRGPLSASGRVLPLSPTSCTCRPAAPAGREPLPPGSPPCLEDDRPGEVADARLPAVGCPRPAPALSPPDSPPAGPSHAPLYLRIAHLIV